MRRNYSSLFLLGSVIGISLVVMIMLSVPTMVTAQIPTGSIPTVTGPPMTAFIVVLDNEQGFANVRSGPGTLGYDVIGVLVVGQQAAALGRTVVGDWILIAYPGVPGGQAWIFKDLVEVAGGFADPGSPANTNSSDHGNPGSHSGCSISSRDSSNADADIHCTTGAGPTYVFR